MLHVIMHTVADWPKMPNRWATIGAGLEATCRRAGAAYEEAAAEPSVEKLHEWRKQAKYLRYQLEILTPIWSERMGELAGEAAKMGELLGDDNDLAVLRQMLIDDPDRFGDTSDQEALLALIDRRRAELMQEAVLLGQRFFQDRPREFVRHLKGYWKSWNDALEPPLKV